jgi:hypothetical protein
MSMIHLIEQSKKADQSEATEQKEEIHKTEASVSDFSMPRPKPMAPPTDISSYSLPTDGMEALIIPSPVSDRSMDCNSPSELQRTVSNRTEPVFVSGERHTHINQQDQPSERRFTHMDAGRPRFNRNDDRPSYGKGGKNGKGGKGMRNERWNDKHSSGNVMESRSGKGGKVLISPYRYSDLQMGSYNQVDLTASPLVSRLMKADKVGRNALSVPSVLNLTLDVTGQRRAGLKPSASHPLVEVGDKLYCVPKGQFVNNNLDLIYSDVLSLVMLGELDSNMLPLKNHVFSKSYGPAESLLNYSLMGLPIRTNDKSPNDVKKGAFDRFSDCGTVKDALDRVISNVDFASLGHNCDFSEFINVCGGEYVWFVTMLSELLAEVPLSRSTMVCPIIPMLDTYSPYRKIGNCFTLDTSPSSYVSKLMSKITDSNIKQKLLQRLEFAKYVEKCSSQGLAKCIPDGVGILNICTIHDNDLCMSTIMNDAFVSADTRLACIHKVILDVSSQCN